MSKRDYYEVLGIDKSSSEAEIKKSYRTLAKKYHPDVSTENNAEASFYSRIPAAQGCQKRTACLYQLSGNSWCNRFRK